MSRRVLMGSAPRIVRTRDGSPTLWSREYSQTYGSVAGALTEAQWVYLRNSGVADRLRSGQPTRVLEIGLGTGLNFLITADAAWRHRVKLQYHAIEQSPVAPAIVRRLRLNRYMRWQPLYERWMSAYATSPIHDSSARSLLCRWQFAHPPFVQLQLDRSEATACQIQPASFDAIYHDAFSPDENSELWSQEFLQILVASLAPGGRLVSYCVQGRVKRTLKDFGLQVSSQPGPPRGKRETLLAVRIA